MLPKDKFDYKLLETRKISNNLQLVFSSAYYGLRKFGENVVYGRVDPKKKRPEEVINNRLKKISHLIGKEKAKDYFNLPKNLTTLLVEIIKTGNKKKQWEKVKKVAECFNRNANEMIYNYKLTPNTYEQILNAMVTISDDGVSVGGVGKHISVDYWKIAKKGDFYKVLNRISSNTQTINRFIRDLENGVPRFPYCE